MFGIKIHIKSKFQDVEEDFEDYRAYLIIAVVLTACCKIVSIDLLGIHRNLHGKLAKRVKFLHLIRQVVHFGVQIVHFVQMLF